MATQTVSVSRAPVNGGSHSSGMPSDTLPSSGQAATIDYSLTDLDLLETPDAPAGDAGTAPPSERRTADAEGKPTAGNEREAAPENKDAARSPSDDEEAHGLTPKPRDRATAEFDRAFELPGIGPKLREICERETAYREIFPTADAARAAAAAQADLARLDRLVESRDPRAHAELLAGLQRLAPEAFRDLALTFGERLAELDPEAYQQVSAAMAAQALAGQRLPAAAGWPEHVALLSRAVEQQDWPAVKFLAATLSSNLAKVAPAANVAPTSSSVGASRNGGIVPLQLPAAPTEGRQDAGATAAPGALHAAANQFLETVNTGVEQAVQASVASKVAELLPDVAEGARQKIAGEIFRELDQVLRQDPELLEQVRESVRGVLRSGPAAGNAQPAERIAQLIAGRARAALPGVAKRVVADWTETVLRSSQTRRSRQSEAASRVEVGRGGAPGPVPLKPRGVDYARMSDEEILNMD
jgi:hypothetical protein